MEEIFLDVQPREELGKSKVKPLRQQGFIPAVVYSQGKKTEVVKILNRDFLRLQHEYHLESVIINLRMQADTKKAKQRPCVIKEIQYDPVHEDVIHVDFNQISLTKAIKINVGVETKGEAVGVKVDGGVLEHILWEIEVECLPTQIPEKFEVDVNNLKIGDAIHVRDLPTPQGVKIINDPESIVLSVAPPAKEEVVAAPVEGEEKLEPEVISEKKEEAEEAEEEVEEAPKEKAKAKEEKEK